MRDAAPKRGSPVVRRAALLLAALLMLPAESGAAEPLSLLPGSGARPAGSVPAPIAAPVPPEGGATAPSMPGAALPPPPAGAGLPLSVPHAARFMTMPRPSASGGTGIRPLLYQGPGPGRAGLTGRVLDPAEFVPGGTP